MQCQINKCTHLEHSVNEILGTDYVVFSESFKKLKSGNDQLINLKQMYVLYTIYFITHVFPKYRCSLFGIQIFAIFKKKTMLFYDSNTANSNILVVSKFSWIQYITKSVNRITTWMALVPSPLSIKVSVITDAFLTSASESDFNKALQQAKTCFKSQKNAHVAV